MPISKERRREIQHRWASNNRDYYRGKHLERKYGINLDRYKEMLVAQEGVCAICGELDQFGKALSVDHNHKTGKIRKLLCTRCNVTIGKAEESVELLQKMIDYIRADDLTQEDTKDGD